MTLQRQKFLDVVGDMRVLLAMKQCTLAGRSILASTTFDCYGNSDDRGHVDLDTMKQLVTALT